MLRDVLIPVLSVAESLLAAALFFIYLTLRRLGKQMNEEIDTPATSGLNTGPWTVYRRFVHLHPGSVLGRCYILLNVSFLLLALGIGAVSYCFGRFSTL